MKHLRTALAPYRTAFSRVLALAIAVQAGCQAPDLTDASEEIPAEVVSVSAREAQGIVGSRVTPSPRVRVLSLEGNPISNVPVEWLVTGGGGTTSSRETITDAAGEAGVEWILGTRSGVNTLTAAISSVPQVTFTVSASADAPFAISRASGDQQSAAAGSALSRPLEVTLVDLHGNPVVGANVTFAADANAGTMSPSIVPTNSAGTAASTWTLGNAIGSQRASATHAHLTTRFAATVVTATATRLTLANGNNQSVVAGSLLAAPLTVAAEDNSGKPVSGVTVAWSLEGQVLSSSTTSASGTATFAGVADGFQKAGSTQISATAPGLDAVVFSVTIRPGTGAQITKVSGDEQVATAGGTQSSPLVVRVVDRFGNPTAGGDVVLWRAVSGDGSFTSVRTASSSNGVAQTSWRLGIPQGPQAARATLEGGTQYTDFTATASGFDTMIVITNGTNCTLNVTSPYGSKRLMPQLGNGQVSDNSVEFPVHAQGRISLAVEQDSGLVHGGSCGYSLALRSVENSEPLWRIRVDQPGHPNLAGNIGSLVLRWVDYLSAHPGTLISGAASNSLVPAPSNQKPPFYRTTD